jgi:hypothetical protein
MKSTHARNLFAARTHALVDEDMNVAPTEQAAIDAFTHV